MLRDVVWRERVSFKETCKPLKALLCYIFCRIRTVDLEFLERSLIAGASSSTMVEKGRNWCEEPWLVAEPTHRCYFGEAGLFEIQIRLLAGLFEIQISFLKTVSAQLSENSYPRYDGHR